MALIKCNECGHEVSDKASFCPNCGCPIEHVVTTVEEQLEENPPKKKGWIWALIVALLCLIGGGGYYAYTKLFNDGIDKDAIVELTPEFISAIQKYEKLGTFSEGLAAVMRGGKWGYINTKGEEVIPCQFPIKYDDYIAKPFYEGMALIEKDNKYGFINTKGEEVIPINIEAEYVGRFSEGLAFVYKGDGNFSVINKKGEEIFHADCMDFLAQFGRMFDESMIPFYKQGVLFVPIVDDNEYDVRYVVYDKQGNKIKESDGSDEQSDTVLYSVFSKENGNDEELQNYTYGLEDSKKNEIIPAIFDDITFESKENGEISNGVVLVVLAEIGEDAFLKPANGELLSENTKYHYGYADLKGNDTFSDALKDKCGKRRVEVFQRIKEQEEEEMRLMNESPDWLQGRWVGRDANSGYPIEVIINGDKMIQKLNGQVFYNGTYEFNGDMLIYNNANDFWPVDRDRQVLTYDGTPMRKESGSSTSYSSNDSYSDSGSSNNNSYRFSSAHDVIGYLADKSFYNGSRRLRIRPDGVWLNDYCATGAPNVERFESWKALIRAYTATGQRLSFLIDPIHGQITDEAGDVFSLR